MGLFPQLFRVLTILSFHEYFYKSIETRKISFLFHLENTAPEKGKQLLHFVHHSVNSLFARAIITSTARSSAVFPSSYRNSTRFLTNQHAYSSYRENEVARVFSLGCFVTHQEKTRRTVPSFPVGKMRKTEKPHIITN